MPSFRSFLIKLTMPHIPAAAAAGDIEAVKSVCNSTGGVAEIVAKADDLVVWLSPLPGGCAWLPATTYGRIGETLFLAEAPGDRVARITHVFLVGREG